MIRFKLLMFLMFGMSFSVLAMERQHSFQPAPQQHGQWIQQARGQVAEVDRRQQAAAERQRDVGQVIRDLLDQVRQVTARSTRTVEEADRRLQAIVERQRDVRRVIRDLLEQDMSPENMLQLVRQSGLSDNAIRLILRQVEEEDRRQHYVEQVIRDLSQEDMSPEDIIQRLSGWSDDVIRPCLQEFLERIQQDKQMQEDHEMTLRLDEEEQENERNREAAQRVHEEEVRSRSSLEIAWRGARTGSGETKMGAMVHWELSQSSPEFPERSDGSV